MSTHSRIGIINPDGTIRSIYCHFDGYPEGVGLALSNGYTDVDKINKLLDLGDISCIGPEPESKSEYWDFDFSSPYRECTRAYRDRGEDCPAYIDENEENFWSRNTEYKYLFYPELKEWKVIGPYGREEHWLEEYLKNN